MMKDNKLVTVAVITYNSSKYVKETLDSVADQTYSPIELIISDDCSTDDTEAICKEWISQNKTRFKRVLFVKTSGNGGICRNYNNALAYAEGRWIKYIAGDDILTPDCIECYLKAAKQSDHKVLIGGVVPFTDAGKILPERNAVDGIVNASSAREQEKFMVKAGTVVEGPTLFIDKDWLRSQGGFEETYPMIEDYPLVMRSLKNGYMIGHIKECCVRYREYPESVSRSNVRFADSIYRAIKNYAPKAAMKHGMVQWWWHYMNDSFINLYYHNQKWMKPLVIMMRLCDPIYIRKKWQLKNG